MDTKHGKQDAGQTAKGYKNDGNLMHGATACKSILPVLCVALMQFKGVIK